MLSGTGGHLGFLCTERVGVGVYSAGGGRQEKIGDCEQSNGRISLRKQPTLYFWLAENDSTNEKRYPDLGTDTSSVWNFCARFSDFISRGKPAVAPRYVGSFFRLRKKEDCEQSKYHLAWRELFRRIPSAGPKIWIISCLVNLKRSAPTKKTITIYNAHLQCYHVA